MELLVGIAVGTIFVVGAATIIAPSLQVNKQAGTVQQEAQFGQQLLGNVQAWSASDWGAVLSLATGTANRYYLNTTSSPFIAIGTSTAGESLLNCSAGATSTNCISYYRYFYLTDIYRDANGNTTTTATGNYYDPSTKLATVVVGMASSTQSPLTYSAFIFRSGNNVLDQGTWIGGSASTSSPVSFVSSTYGTANEVTVTATGALQLSQGPAPGGACRTQQNLSIAGEWPIDEGSGTIAYDASGNGGNGTWYGTQSSPSGTYYTGGTVEPYAGYFNGTDDYIMVSSSSPAANAGGNITVTGWIYMKSCASWSRMMDFGNGPGASNIIIAATNGTTCQPVWALYNGSTALNGNLTDPHVVSTTQWVFLSGVASGTSDYLYVNGTDVASGTMSAALGTAVRGYDYIGKSNWSDQLFNGYINDVRMYDRALSPSEIATLYAGGTVN